MSTTTIIVEVREDRECFHGRVAHVAVQGDGSPKHFEFAAREAMRQATQNIPTVARIARPLQAQRELSFA